MLEVGAGAGRFTEWLLKAGATLITLDASIAVVANRNNCATLGRYGLLQADIDDSPLRLGSFDVVLCLGVIQHRRSPEATIKNLAAHLAPRGLLVIDHYTYRSRLGAVSACLTLAYPIRAVLRRLAPS